MIYTYIYIYVYYIRRYWGLSESVRGTTINQLLYLESILINYCTTTIIYYIYIDIHRIFMDFPTNYHRAYYDCWVGNVAANLEISKILTSWNGRSGCLVGCWSVTAFKAEPCRRSFGCVTQPGSQVLPLKTHSRCSSKMFQGWKQWSSHKIWRDWSSVCWCTDRDWSSHVLRES